MLKKKNNIFLKNYIVFIDQGLVSFCNFVISILIVKFSGLEVFGVFCFYWLIYILIFNLQKSLIITPMLTNYTNVSKKNIPFFFGQLNILQILFAVTVLILVFYKINIMFFMFHDLNFLDEGLIQKFAFLIFFSTFYNFIRKEFFLKEKKKTTLLLDFLSYSVIILGLIYFKRELNIQNIFNIFIFSHLLTFLIYFFNLKNYKYDYSSLKKYFRQNFALAKWVFLGSICNNISNFSLFFYLGLVLGPSVLGAVRACYQLANSCNLFFQAFENFWLQKISSDLKKNINLMKSNLLNQIKNFLLILLPTLFLMIYFADLILPIFFTKEILPFIKIYVFMLLVVPILFIKFPLEFTLNAMQKPQVLFYASLLVLFLTLTLSKILILKYQMLGFAIILLIFHLIPSSVMFFYYIYYIKKF